MLKYDSVVISGGNVPFLLESLEKHNIAEQIRGGKHKMKAIAGIGAGAIALSRSGVGMKDGIEFVFNGMGLFPSMVAPHADTIPSRHLKYSDAIPLGARAIRAYF